MSAIGAGVHIHILPQEGMKRAETLAGSLEIINGSRKRHRSCYVLCRVGVTGREVAIHPSCHRGWRQFKPMPYPWLRSNPGLQRREHSANSISRALGLFCTYARIETVKPSTLVIPTRRTRGSSYSRLALPVRSPESTGWRFAIATATTSLDRTAPRPSSTRRFGGAKVARCHDRKLYLYAGQLPIAFGAAGWDGIMVENNTACGNLFNFDTDN